MAQKSRLMEIPHRPYIGKGPEADRLTGTPARSAVISSIMPRGELDA